MKKSRKTNTKVKKKVTRTKKRKTHRGELELGEVFIILLLFVGIIAGSMYLGTERLHSIPEDDRTTMQILNGGLDSIERSFLQEVVAGDYDIKVYRWVIGKSSDKPDAVPLGEEGRLTADILFNGTYINSVRGLGFKVYTPTAIDTKTRIMFVGVFLNHTTPMDEWLKDDSEFSVRYFPYPTFDNVFEGCHVRASDIYRTAEDNVFRTYYFDCAYSWEGSYPSTTSTFED